jgi:hypothetical protein
MIGNRVRMNVTAVATSDPYRENAVPAASRTLYLLITGRSLNPAGWVLFASPLRLATS